MVIDIPAGYGNSITFFTVYVLSKILQPTSHEQIRTSDVDAEPVLLRLEEATEDGDLHVERHLGVHERLVLVQLVGQLVQQPLDLVLLRRQLNIEIKS